MPKPTKSKPPKTAVPRPGANGAAAPEVMTLAEAAAWLRVPEEGLRADAEAGRVPARLVAGEWRFNKNSLRIWFGQAEPQANRPKTGAELVERIRQIRATSPYPETEAEAEEFIRKVYAMREADSAAG
jgi:hypothetical protein